MISFATQRIEGNGGKQSEDKPGTDRRTSSLRAACPSWQRQSVFDAVYITRPALTRRRPGFSISRVASQVYTLLMAKRRTIVDSDDEQGDNQLSPSGTKRSRLDGKNQTEHRSSKSKGKGKARDNNDILNDIRVDDDDDITAIRDARAEEDEGSQERFEEEHEESIRESIRQRSRQQGVRSSMCIAIL